MVPVVDQDVAQEIDVATLSFDLIVDGRHEEGPDPGRRDGSTFFGFQDPDGNGCSVQEVGRQA